MWGLSQSLKARPKGLRGLSVLVADDDRFARQIVRLILEEAGISQVIEAGSGEEALRALQTQAFGLAILDIHMPPTDGLTVARHMRQGYCALNGQTPIVIMTVRCDKALVATMRQAGVDQLCLKPLSPESLMARVRRALDARAATPPPTPKILGSGGR